VLLIHAPGGAYEVLLSSSKEIRMKENMKQRMEERSKIKERKVHRKKLRKV
jgi:hypothetical protein